MHLIRKIINISFVGVILVCVAVNKAKAQHASTQDPPAEQKKSKSVGDVMLKLGRGLLKEVSRRLNLEETEIVTVKKEIAADGREKYRVDTGKFSFTVRKKSKPDTTSKK